MKLLGNKAIVHIPLPKSTSGIILPSSVENDDKGAWKRGTVVVLGTGIKPECNVKVGDVVLFQFGFDTMEKSALAAVSKGDGKTPFAAEGDLWIGNPESLFAIVESHGKESNKKPRASTGK